MLDQQIEKAKEFLAMKKLQDKHQSFLPLNLQFFAKKEDESSEDDDLDEDESEDDEDEDEDDSSEPSLEQMLKDNPTLKKEFNKLFKTRFDKRLKGVDLTEAKKALAKMKELEDQENEDESKGKSKADEIDQKAIKLENKTKRLAVKEYAVDNDLNPKLLARLVDLDKIELDDDGDIDPDDLEELVDEITEEFPELFRKATQEDEGEDEEEDTTTTRKNRSHKVGSKKKTNKPKASDLREAGKQRALERAKARGLIKE